MMEQLLPWFNLLLVPMTWHVIRTESRISALEAKLSMVLMNGSQKIRA